MPDDQLQKGVRQLRREQRDRKNYPEFILELPLYFRAEVQLCRGLW